MRPLRSNFPSRKLNHSKNIQTPIPTIPQPSRNQHFPDNVKMEGGYALKGEPQAKLPENSAPNHAPATSSNATTRREFLATASRLAAATTIGVATSRLWNPRRTVAEAPPLLQEFDYSDVAISSDLHTRQREQSLAILMDLSDDSLLKPLRAMAGQDAPGEELGGWYLYDPNFDGKAPSGAGFAPACTFGQWISALARNYATTRDEKIRERILRLNQLYAKTITPEFYDVNRFPAYCYDKFVCGLMDSHRLANDGDAYRILDATTEVATPHLPGRAIEHGRNWRPGKNDDWSQDESYTMPENLFLAYQRGAGDQYKTIATQYLDEEYFAPLSEGRSNFAGRHAYSHVNALSSAMQTYLTLGSEKHLRAAKTGFDLLAAQSYATGGWGPDETLRAPNSDDGFASLANTHSSFETPCGAYAHLKLTRYLLRVTREPRYGDSMERVMYNTVLGAKPLLRDGSTFYYSDYNVRGSKVYSKHAWACCSGTLPQIATDYGISSYFRDKDSIFVNLYIPSTLRWTQDGATISLRQSGDYPFDSAIRFDIKTPKPRIFALQFRIPAWSQNASLSLNGKRVADAVLAPGTFTAFRREWKNNDRIELELPMTTRLEPIDRRHLNTVALMSGPLVLFAINDSAAAISRKQLLAAIKTAKREWTVQTESASVKMLPFTEISDQPYSTYLNVTS
jgi:DUF1680 family protein